ncbi:MAG: type II toxin-antitoxin system RelE/ParE family toxin [Gammaproteobacteria bacterium]
MKDIVYYASAQKDIAAFSTRARQCIARLLEMLAEGLDLQPSDFKYMPTVGAGIYELRVRTDKQYRVFYVAKLPKAIYVLHAFIKKTQQTSQKDIDKGRERYKTLLHCREGKGL